MIEQTQAREAVAWTQPSHPELIKVLEQGDDGSFSTRAASLVSLPAGAVFCDLSAARKASKRTYATVQASETSDIDLNSDVVYFNHSCNPSMVIDTSNMQVRVADKPIKEGNELTLFYPSFEWNMSQPFDCICGEKCCVGRVQGASHMDKAKLEKYWLNDHIKRLLGASVGHANGNKDASSANGVNGSNGH